MKPEAEVSAYKGIEVEKVVKAITDEDIDRQIENLRNRNARVVTIDDRAAETGDEVVIDFKGFVDGVAFEGGEAEQFTLPLGSNQFIPGFEEQIVGHKTGEEFEINVTFPENYSMETLYIARLQYSKSSYTKSKLRNFLKLMTSLSRIQQSLKLLKHTRLT